ncbi:hypothetical protein BC941DRAFT_71408 [Chlamydoabsidia padenii]|nr:hypothetical protein BC941DRAFT_71408 [Chlamydoabsidia padenii]
MGAKIRKTFADTVTHLIYKNGSSMNVKKAIHNKCKIVNLLWITNCKSKGTRLPEVNYLIEQPENLLLPGLKKRKSMEPGQVKALILDEQVEKLTLSKRSGTTQNTQLSKRPKPASSKYTSAIISKEATNINNLDRSSLLTNRKFRSGGSGESLSSAIHIIPDRQVQPTCSSFESAKDMSIKNSAPESQKPQVNKSIKAGFYIGNQSQTETSSSTSKSTKTSTAIPTTPTTKSPLLVRRKRRSVMMSSPTPTAATIIKPSSDLHHPLPDLVRPNSDDTSNLPSIVMTNMTEQEKKTCSNIISKLGTYRVATSVDKTTTHIIVGCQRRTESVIMGLLYGTWLVTPAWLLDSMKLNRYLAESDYEAILLFPRANAARRRDPLLPSNTHIYINSAACTIHHDLAQEIVTKAGGTVVGNPEKADIVISNTLMATGAIVVMENWILDSIEQWQYLSTSKYIPPAN